MAIHETSEFKTVVGYAKAIARAVGQHEISIPAFLAGVEVALARSEIAVDPEIYGEPERKGARGLIHAAGLNSEVEGPLSESMEGAADFLAVVRRCSDMSFSEFMRVLSGGALSSSAFIPGDEYKLCMSYAVAVMQRNGLDSITPETFLLGAWAAFRAGKLEGCLTLRTHLQEHAAAIEALMQQNQLQMPEACADELDLQARLFESEFQSVMAEREPLLTLLSIGLSKGLQLASLECTAYHEAGHAVVSLVLRPNIRIPEVSIVQKNGSLGATTYMQLRKSTETREDFLEEICVLLAGQIAQIIKYGENAADIGANGDFERATLKAWEGIAVRGLDPEFGPVNLMVLRDKCNISQGWIFDEAQRRLQALLKEQFAQAESILRTHWSKVEIVAKLLLEKQVIAEEEVRTLLAAG